MSRTIFKLAAVMSLMILPPASFADGFGINATRLIYQQGEKSISVTVRNTLKEKPYLVQTNVSKELNNASPAPFIVTPPLFRLEAQSTNQLKIAFNGSILPNDRESVFYLNATAIPASDAANKITSSGIDGFAQFGVGNIIKIFYRPTGLKDSSSDAQKNITFTKIDNGLRINNKSPYYINLASLRVSGKNIPLDTNSKKMINPFSSQDYFLTIGNGVIEWQTINDIGGLNAFRANI